MILKMKNRFKHLSINERYKIKILLEAGMNISEIAKELNRAKSSISLEIRRNKHNGDYLPCVAQKVYQERLQKEDGLKIEKDQTLRDYVVEKLKVEYYSPDAISGRLKLDDNMPNISTESIYNFIYTSPVASTLSLYKYLPTRRLKRQKRSKRRQRVVIPARISIHEREKVAD